MSELLNPNDLISQVEAADLRGVTRASINELIKRGRLRTVEIGGKPLLYRSEVLSFTPGKGGRPPKQAPVASRSTSEIRSANVTARKLNEAFRKAAEDEQKASKKKGGKR